MKRTARRQAVAAPEERTRCTVASPVGPLRLSATAEGLCEVAFDAAEPPGAPATPLLEEAARQLEAYFDGRLRDFTLPLAPEGTEFQLRVWRALRAIPHGTTASYGEVARALGDVKAVRAVGLANGKNPLAIVVPCHRVIGASGDLVGYAGGLPRKRWLLAHESPQRSLLR